MLRPLCVLVLWTVIVPLPAFPAWYKGNTHTHTVNSDGDSAPDVVAGWYKEHGYQFVVLTDHNFVTNVQGLNVILAAEEKFLVLPGEEVTDKFQEPGKKKFELHMNALNLERTVQPAGGGSIAETLRCDVEAVNAAGALVQLNHPNFRWSLGVEEMFRLPGYSLFELYNASTNCNNFGGGEVIGTEALWDSLLTRGKLVYGVAGDDTHDLKAWGVEYSNPGRAWVCVRAERLEAGEITGALARGDFYASTGVVLKNIEIRPESYSVEVEVPEDGQTRYTVYFIGHQGRVLARAISNPAHYRITGREGYVRAKVVDSNGLCAWTQPVMTGGL